MYTIDFWPVLVSAVVAFLISALWYSPILFGKEWMSLNKVSEKDIADARSKGGMWRSYVIQFVATLVSFSVLGFIVASSSSVTAADGAFLGFLVWLGFVAASMVGALLWEKRPMKLVLIDGINYLLGLVVGGAIIGGWK